MTTQESSSVPSVECREAFEQWMRDRFHILSSGLEINSDVGYYWDDSVQKRWEAWQASLHWNRRTEPPETTNVGDLSPAEVGSDNCQICNGKRGGVFGNENIEDGVVICDYCHSDRMKFRSISQQSPATVEGELTDEEITALAQEHLKAFAQFGSQAGEVWVEGEIEFARAIARALNQRLAVKEKK